MSVEDRLRTATRARADLVSDIRPLDLPAREPARLRRAPGSRRWMAWAAPAAAAALVVALAMTLVSIRQARNESPIAAAAQPGAAAISARRPGAGVLRRPQTSGTASGRGPTARGRG